jgi:hypothetical protein
MAERTIASLPLGDGPRRFAKWWLAQLARTGNDNEAQALDEDIASCTLIYEVRPGQGVTCRSSGARIDSTLGMQMRGRDILELIAPELRASALARHENVAAGGLQFSLRRVVEPGGSTHLLQEIGVPHPGGAQESGTTVSMAYVDIAMLDSGSKLELSPAALDLVEMPLFADLRPVPRVFERETARAAFARLTLSAKNRALASYWLSLWEGDSLPRRAAFQPGRVPSLVGGICLFEVTPHEGVFCRTAGSAIRSALGFNIAGTDWLAQTDPYQRASRLRGFTDVALGLAGATRRRVTDPTGRPLTVDGLMLPFRDVETDGVRYVLTHDDWRPTQPASHFAQLVNASRVAAEFRTIRLG